MTDLRRKIFDYYKSQIKENGYPPTLIETAGKCKCNPSYVWYTLEYLEKRGYIAKEPKTKRTVKILREN